MNRLVAAAVLAASMSASSAFAVSIQPPADALYTCAGTSLSRVSFEAEHVPCCKGMLGCPQLLSNTGLVKPKRSNRT